MDIIESKVNYDAWERKEIFDFFSELSDPFYMIAFRQNVTKLYHFTKQHHISFYYALVYLCTKAINSIPAFHYVIRQSDIYYLMQDLENAADAALKDQYPLYYDLMIYKIDGKSNL